MFLSESGPETLEILSAEIVQNHVASELFLVPVTDIARYRELSTEDTLQDGKRQRMCLIAKILWTLTSLRLQTPQRSYRSCHESWVFGQTALEPRECVRYHVEFS